jgi:GNAT superfamily N-acetyltransferase
MGLRSRTNVGRHHLATILSRLNLANDGVNFGCPRRGILISRIELRNQELMRLHVEALFTHDAEGHLVGVNEPSGALAPRFFIGITDDGVVCRFRYDLGAELRNELARFAPVKKTETGPAFGFPLGLPATADTVLVTEENAHILDPFLREWIPDVPLCRPMIVLAIDGRAVAICCSVRRTNMAHEAGVETAAPYRGHGYAGQVVAAWARAVRDRGRVPLYSTSWTNEASRAVARKLALIHFGSDLHIT